MQPKFLITLLPAIVLIGFSHGQLAAADGYPTGGNYKQMFRANPLKAYKYVVKLRNYPNQPALDEQELELLEDALDGQLDSMSFDDAALTVAGVRDPHKRESFKLQLDGMAEKCRIATAKMNSPEKKADAILHYLKAGPMKPGYRDTSLNFAKTLEVGTYNCVCSSILFQAMTHRLDIDAVTVNVPRHVFCRVGNTDYETTSGTSAKTERRNERYLKDRLPVDNKPGAPFENMISRETNDLGLLALHYLNEGASMYDDPNNADYGTATVKMFKAACLDMESPWIAVILEKTIRKWFNAELSKKRFREAKWVADFYKKVIRDESYADEFYTALATATANAGIKDRASIARKN